MSTLQTHAKWSISRFMDGLVGLSSLILRTLVNGSRSNSFTVRLQSRILHSFCLSILWLAFADKDK